MQDKKKATMTAMETLVSPDIDIEEPQKVVLELQEVDEKIKGFYLFVSFRKGAAKAELDFISRKEERKNNGLDALPREIRRVVNKNLPSNNVLPKAIRELKAMYEITDRLIEAIEDEKALDDDNSFCQLVMMDVLYEKYDGVINKMGLESISIIDYFIKQAKEQKKTCNFLKCYDDEGKVLPDMAYYLRTIIFDNFRDIYNSCAAFKSVQQEDCIESLISDEIFKQAAEIAKIKNDQRKLEEERLKEEKRLAKEKEEQERKNKKKEVVVVKKTYNEMDELYKKIITPGKYTLRKGIDEVMTLEELKVILDKLTRIPAIDKEKFINEYLVRVYTRRLNYVMKISSKGTLKKIKNILSNEKNNMELFEAFKSVLQSDEFEELSDEQIMDSIEAVLNDKYLKKTNTMQNFIIFASDNLVSEEVSRIYDSKCDQNKLPIIKSLQNHLQTLQRHDLNQIKANKSDAFHELMMNHKVYTIANSLKGYRYGARKAKIGLCLLSVSQGNQDKLQEIYKQPINNVILVFGMGNVMTEKEDDLMNRMKKQGLDMENEITRISNIFAKSFTDETLAEAKKLINDGILTIDSLIDFDDPINVKKCPILKKEDD